MAAVGTVCVCVVWGVGWRWVGGGVRAVCVCVRVRVGWWGGGGMGANKSEALAATLFARVGTFATDTLEISTLARCCGAPNRTPQGRRG